MPDLLGEGITSRFGVPNGWQGEVTARRCLLLETCNSSILRILRGAQHIGHGGDIFQQVERERQASFLIEVISKMGFLEEDLRGEQSFRDDGIAGTPTQQSLLRIRYGDVGTAGVDTISQLHDMNCSFHDDQHAVAQTHHSCDLAIVGRPDLH